MTPSAELLNYIESLIHLESFKSKHILRKEDFTRNRTLTFPLVIAHLLNGSKKSLQIECNLLGDLLNHQPVSKQALSLARYKLAPSAFFELHEETIRKHYEDNDQRLWNGFRVFGCDGTTLQLPKTNDIPEYFGDHCDSLALARVCQFVEVTSDIVVSAAIGPYSTGETTLAELRFEELTSKMKALGQNKQLYLYDRGFPSHKYAKRHLDLEVDFLFRIPRKFNPKIDKLIESGEEHDTLLHFKRKEFEYTARIIVTYLQSGQVEVLMTSLLNQNQFSSKLIIDLYHSRWRCEESYKFQKYLLEQENFTGRTTLAILQEFWASVFLTALFAIHCKEKEEKDAQKDPKEINRKINRRVVYASIRQTMLRALMREIPMKSFEDRFQKLASRHKIPIKEGRSVERTVTKRKKRRHYYRRIL